MRYSLFIDVVLICDNEMPLDGGIPVDGPLEALDEMSLDAVFAWHDVRDRDAAMACLAGLRLRFNDLTGAHKIAQDLATPEGSFWHAIVHRREGDYWNAKYWIRQVGLHPIYLELGQKVGPLAADVSDAPSWMRESHWDPYGFVDLVEKCRTGVSDLTDLCVKTQQVEWQSLFDYCYQEGCQPFEAA